MDILGWSILERTAARLQSAVSGEVFAVTDAAVTLRDARKIRVSVVEEPQDRWSAVRRMLEKMARQGVQTALIAELGAYVEFDVAAAVLFHIAKGQAATPLCDAQGPLGYWIVDPARVMSDRGVRLSFVEDELTEPPAPYFVEGYTNRLTTAPDFRQLVVDAFLGRCSIVPRGEEIKPGVWVDIGATWHKTARLVAPVYLGRHTRIQRGAVVTQFSNLERRSILGEGSVVANASVLPQTMIGRGLDISSALVEGSRFVDLSRNVALRLQDPLLISNAVPAIPDGPEPSREFEHLDRPRRLPEVDYSYLSRAAGRLLEVFKGEV